MECPFCQDLTDPYRHRFVHSAEEGSVPVLCDLWEGGSDCHYDSDRSGGCENTHKSCGSEEEEDGDRLVLALHRGSLGAVQAAIIRSEGRILYVPERDAYLLKDCHGHIYMKVPAPRAPTESFIVAE